MAREKRTTIFERAPSTRDWTILLVFTLLFAAIVARLVWVQVIDADENAQKARDSHTTEVVQTVKRGTIYDRNGETIAASIDATTIYADPSEITDAEGVARVLAAHLEGPYKLAYADCLSLVTTPNTSFVYIKRKADADVAQALKEELKSKNLAGIHYLSDSKRVYPNDETGTQVIGSIDVDGNGIAGLEMQYNDILSGSSGTSDVTQGLKGIPMVGVTSGTDATDATGSSIKTSIDIKLQQRCETSLLSTIEEYKAKGGSATVVDAATGEIYAACSFTQKETTDEEAADANGTDEEAADADGEKLSWGLDVGKIWSVNDSYEPGSTFKALTAAAVLEHTDTTPDTVFSVPSKLQVYDSTVTDSHEHGDLELSLTSIIAQSSNIGMVKAGETLSNEQLRETYKAFGIGVKPETDFPGVVSGLLEQTSDWDGVQEANITFGQGLSTSALQMARAYCALEQGGTLRTPHFLTEVVQDEAASREYAQKFSATSTACDAEVCAQVTGMLREVVASEEGTGSAAAIEGFDVVGKTGTAEVADNSGRYRAGTYIVSFAGWLEGSTSDLVCIVTVEEPQTEAGGGPVCGPVFADIMSFAIGCYQISPDRS